ncbi:MAG: hypothetical protein IPP51_12780 [Bacteroidetes bacterium]|nr:hypothetical protein [Bacteroidota bacterium]
MDNKQKFRAIVLPALAIVFALGAYSRLDGTENIRPIHMVSLMAIGMAIGVLLRNVILLFRGRL